MSEWLTLIGYAALVIYAVLLFSDHAIEWLAERRKRD